MRTPQAPYALSILETTSCFIHVVCLARTCWDKLVSPRAQPIINVRIGEQARNKLDKLLRNTGATGERDARCPINRDRGPPHVLHAPNTLCSAFTPAISLPGNTARNQTRPRPRPPPRSHRRRGRGRGRGRKRVNPRLEVYLARLLPRPLWQPPAVQLGPHRRR